MAFGLALPLRGLRDLGGCLPTINSDGPLMRPEPMAYLRLDKRFGPPAISSFPAMNFSLRLREAPHERRCEWDVTPSTRRLKNSVSGFAGQEHNDGTGE